MTGASLILAATLLSFPQPMITRYLIDDVILSHRLNLLAGTILVLIAVAGGQRIAVFLQDFFFTRFEQQVLLDIQESLLKRVLRFPKSFFRSNPDRVPDVPGFQ